jgi:hypothetical protein
MKYFSAIERASSLVSTDKPYFGKLAILPTLHGKESVIAPIFQNELGIEVQVAEIDTDQFGTFAGEIPRSLSQLDAAIAKARSAISRTGTPLAIASEGTIGPNPLIPMASSDFETLVFVDSEQEIVIHESFRSSDVIAERKIVRPGENLDEFLVRADFPNHALIVRTEHSSSVSAFKGIRDKAALEQAVNKLSAEAGSVVVESDLRASFSPSRMKNIAACARLLARRIGAFCPRCSTPGWGSLSPIFGLPCADCGSEVESAVRADQFGCAGCDYKQVFTRGNTFAEPRFCDSCNP